MAATGNNLRVPEDLFSELRSKAEAQGKTVDQLAEEALRAALDNSSWQELLTYGLERGRASGITEEQVPEVVKQWRRERRER